jgi:hypothetical protein
VKAPLFTILVLLAALPAAALTPAEFLEQAAASSSQSKSAMDAARNRLLALMGRYPDFPLGVSIDGPNSASDALPVYIAPLDRLKTFTPGSVVFDALLPTNRILWLVYYPGPGKGKSVVSSVQLTQTPVGWETARMGDGEYARHLWATYVGKEHRPKNAILVQVPSLGVDFIAFVKNGDLQLQPIAPATGYKFDDTSAKSMLLKLAAKAAMHNGQLN